MQITDDEEKFDEDNVGREKMTTENVGPPESPISDLQLDVGLTLLVVKPCFHPFIHSAVYYVP